MPKNKCKKILCKLTDNYCQHASVQSNRPTARRLQWCKGNCPFQISMPVHRMRRQERVIFGRGVTLAGKYRQEFNRRK